jgi:hypothetical protein
MAHSGIEPRKIVSTLHNENADLLLTTSSGTPGESSLAGIHPLRSSCRPSKSAALSMRRGIMLRTNLLASSLPIHGVSRCSRTTPTSLSATRHTRQIGLVCRCYSSWASQNSTPAFLYEEHVNECFEAVEVPDVARLMSGNVIWRCWHHKEDFGFKTAADAVSALKSQMPVGSI